MNPSTDIQILSYLRSNAANLSYFIPASLSFSNRIRKYEKHLDNTFDYLLSYNVCGIHSKSVWVRIVKHFLESLYIPSNSLYIRLEKMYVEQTGEKINRGIIGEKSDFVEEKPNECPVCCEEFSSNDKNLSCGHWVCKSCVVNSGKECCPLCRKVVTLTSNELKSLETIKNKRKLENEINERNQIISQIHSSHIRTIESFIEHSINKYLETLNPMYIRFLQTWCLAYDRTLGENVNQNSTYTLARELINENAGRY